MNFFQVWLAGYYSPSRVVEGLRDAPAPRWGVYGQVARGLLDALLLYLPLALRGETPSPPSYWTLFPTETYYATLIWLAPVFQIVEWLLLCAVLHVLLRLLGRRSDIDQILNITGMVALIVGAFLVAWDWIWILAGWHNEVLLGISHMLIVLWGLAITVLGLVRLMELSLGLALLLNVVWVALGWPLAALIMRAPV